MHQQVLLKVGKLLRNRKVEHAIYGGHRELVILCGILVFPTWMFLCVFVFEYHRELQVLTIIS